MAAGEEEMISVDYAKNMLIEAGKLNPGPWIRHSENVASAAKMIALKTESHDPETAYVCGLLHDIGRRNGLSI
jgi:HD superfamily phosphodiesterase